MLEQKKIEELLERVRKPGRYLGNEWNAVRKDLKRASVKFALAFPDLYEVGMSHLGFKLLYHLLNEEDDIACERVFSPGVDLEDFLRQESLPLFTLESKEPLLNYDVVGFSLAHELNYTNVLNILDLGKIPLEAEERDERYPLVIAGGPSVFNPEPMKDFFDLFIIGEAEEALFEVIEEVKTHKAESRYSKKQLLKALSRIEGVYVPSLYRTDYNEDGTVRAFTPLYDGIPSVIKKRTITDLDKSFYPTKQIVPYISIIHDRVAVEIMRGCPNLCRFCQARALYHHKRERSLKNIMRLAEQSIDETGYEEISLLSLSSGNHSQIVRIIAGLIDRFQSRGISVSLPSLRVDKVLKEFPGLLSRIRKSGLTFAPEAGSKRLRSVIKKDIDIDELRLAIDAAYNAGWRRIKLYFMIGLPTELYEDLNQIVDTIYSILNANRQIDINVSITSFIPKPHTPFQWRAMNREEELRKKLFYIKDKIKNKRVKLKYHDTRLSVLEGIFSRGDGRLGKVILRAFKKGCRFDSWIEHLQYHAWMEAFAEEGIDPSFYVYQERDPRANLPWNHIDCGLSKTMLEHEASAIC